MNKDQLYLTKIRDLVKKLTIQQTANGYHIDQINSYILDSLRSHLMPPQKDTDQSTTFQFLIKQLIIQSKLSITELLQMIVQFLENELMMACFQYTDFLQSQMANVQTKATPQRKPRKQKQTQKQLNPQQLEQFMNLKYLKNQKKYKNEDYYHQRDYYDEYQNELNKQMLEKMLLNSQCKQDNNQDFLQRIRMREQLAQMRGYVDEAVNDFGAKRSNAIKKKLEYFSI